MSEHRTIIELAAEAKAAVKASRIAANQEDLAEPVTADGRGYRLGIRMSTEQRQRLMALKRSLEEEDGVACTMAYAVHWAIMRAHQARYLPVRRRGGPQLRKGGDCF